MLRISSRRILCFLLTILMVIGACTFILSTVIKVTICNKMYMEHFLDTDKISAYCSEIYAERIAALAQNSGIPEDVFEAAAGLDGYSESTVSRFYSGSNTTLFTKDKINAFEKMIKEYLDGNGIAYDDTLVRNTAVKAAEIYSDSFGLKNTQVLKAFIDRINLQYPHISTTGMLAALIGVLLIYVIFNDKKKTLAYYYGALAATGFTLMLVGTTAIVAGIGRSAVITPIVYGDAIFSAVSIMLVLTTAIGVLITIASIVMLLRYYKLTKKTRNK